MPKFKIGDKVKILDGSNIENYTGGWYAEWMQCKVNSIREIVEIRVVDEKPCYRLTKIPFNWDERGLELVKESKNKECNTMNIPKITNYNYNEDTTVTTIKWSDGTKTTVRAEFPDTASQWEGFMAAYAKKAAGNNNTINNLYDEWAIKKPAREQKAQIKANAEFLEEQRIAKKRKAKKEQWLIRKRAAEIAKEYEAKKLAHEKYGVPMDYKAGDTN